MPGDFKDTRSKFAGSILASALVGLVGALGMVFIVAGGGGDPVWTLIVVGLVMVGMTVLFWGINRMSQMTAKDCYNWVFSKKARPEKEYTPQRKASRSKKYGENRPTSAEEVRELKDDMRNWVPSNTSSGKSKLG